MKQPWQQRQQQIWQQQQQRMRQQRQRQQLQQRQHEKWLDWQKKAGGWWLEQRRRKQLEQQQLGQRLNGLRITQFNQLGQQRRQPNLRLNDWLLSAKTKPRPSLPIPPLGVKEKQGGCARVLGLLFTLSVLAACVLGVVLSSA